MYTIKCLLVEDGSAAILASGKDWHEALEKAEKFRKQGYETEIWHSNGVKVPEPEITPDAPSPTPIIDGSCTITSTVFLSQTTTARFCTCGSVMAGR